MKHPQDRINSAAALNLVLELEEGADFDDLLFRDDRLFRFAEVVAGEYNIDFDSDLLENFVIEELRMLIK